MAGPGAVEFFGSQTASAIENHSVRMDPDLPAGATVASSGHSAEHTPPPGGTATSPTVSVNGNTITITVGPLSVSGLHKVEVDIVYDNSGGVTQGVVLWIAVP